MSVIQWLGESEHWQAPRCSDAPCFAMALTERWVLDTATLAAPLRKLSLQAALNCTSRLALRVALASTSLNPHWSPLEWNGPSVVKAPASAANLGVRFLPRNEYIGYVHAIAPDLARFGVHEEFVDGPQFEFDGFVVGGALTWFHPLRQHWNEACDLIVGYDREEPPVADWRDAATAAVRAVGLDDSAFCLEMRYDMGRRTWKVIELHARLGEDPGLAEMMSDECPLKLIERTCAREEEKRGRKECHALMG